MTEYESLNYPGGKLEKDRLSDQSACSGAAGCRPDCGSERSDIDWVVDIFKAVDDGQINRAMQLLLESRSGVARVPATLLPCPFCGDVPIVSVEMEFDGGISIKCENPSCAIQPMTGVGGDTTLKDAETMWNKRARPTE